MSFSCPCNTASHLLFHTDHKEMKEVSLGVLPCGRFWAADDLCAKGWYQEQGDALDINSCDTMAQFKQKVKSSLFSGSVILAQNSFLLSVWGHGL